MNYTIFNTPVIKTLLRGLSLFLMKITGWKSTGSLPDVQKYVLIVAPHTSNWDLFYGILVALALKLDARFMAKKELFRRPFGPVMKWLGGVPIDRSAAGHTVDQVVSAFRNNEKFILAIAPEGTRSRAACWKSGFYHIAVSAGVPIQLGFLDYSTKRGGAGPLLMPTGSIDEDMLVIRRFYLGVTGKYADKAGPVAVTGHNIIS